MEDLTGLGKLADSKLVNKTYDDLLADAAKEGGGLLQDTVKVFRLFTAPIQLLAVAQDRLAKYCDRVRNGVPEERQIEAAPPIAIPILLELRFMEEENPLTEMYLNLLQRSIDRDRVNEAHPAFAKIIGFLSPDEAVILHHLKSNPLSKKAHLSPVYGLMQSIAPNSSSHLAGAFAFPVDELSHPEHFAIYISNLQSQNLVEISTDSPHRNIFLNERLRLTPFGELFITACTSSLEDPEGKV